MQKPISQHVSIFTDEPEYQVSSVGETELLEEIQIWLGEANPAYPEGIGDDCAVLKWDGGSCRLLTTVDGVGYGIHFDDSVPPEGVGHKLIARNLSDIASMGGRPLQAVISLWMDGITDVRWLERFYRGIRESALKLGVKLVGGDVSKATKGTWIADLTLMGVTEKPCLRKGVLLGDTLWVTGSLGGSILKKHWQFEPRLQEGQWLAEYGGVHAMMDISDGLAKDLPTLVGAHQVELFGLPISSDAKQCSEKSGKTPTEHAWSDGEDYELLFALDSEIEAESFIEDWSREFELPLTCIGRVVDEKEQFKVVDQTGEVWKAGRGYEHFREA